VILKKILSPLLSYFLLFFPQTFSENIHHQKALKSQVLVPLFLAIQAHHLPQHFDFIYFKEVAQLMVLLFRLLRKGLGKEVGEGFSLGLQLVEVIFFFMVWDFFLVFTV
jgi:hypothetical protein